MKFHVSSLKYADQHLATGKFDALISIGHPNGTEVCTLEAPRTLRLFMWDVTPYRKAHRGLPSGNQIMDLIAFSRELPDECNVLLHCKRGRSRSTAAALIMLAARGMDAIDAREKLLSQCPKANPNGWMLRLADAIMDSRLFDNTGSIHKWR